MKNTLSFLSDLEQLSGVSIDIVKQGVNDKLFEWHPDCPSTIQSFMYNSFYHQDIPKFLSEGYICRYSNSLGTEDVFIPIDQKQFIVIGPYASHYLSTSEISRRLEEAHITPSSSIHSFFTNQLPVVSVSKIDAVLGVICKVLNINQEEYTLYLSDKNSTLPAFSLLPENTLSVDEKILLRHEQLLYMTAAVSEGNYDKCLQILSTNAHYKIENHFCFDPVMNERIYALQFIFLFYIAAVNGGASIINAEKIYAEFIHQAMVLNNSTEIHKSALATLKSLCNIVSESNHHSVFIQRVFDYLSLHTNARLNLKELCRVMNISQHKLEQQFKSECGITISKYHLDLRIKKAATLLHDHTMSISQVALQTGFEDQNYFSRVFKAHYNCTPSKYRKTLK